jgi:hypothetical protein
MRCYLHPKRAPHLHFESMEQLESMMISGFLESAAVKANPQRYCEHGCYAGDQNWSHSCCICVPREGGKCYGDI